MGAGKLRLMLAVLVAAELLLVYLWMPRQRAALSPGIEERHFITLIVRGPEGRAVERTYETRSVVNPEVLAIRMFSTWYMMSYGSLYSYISMETPACRLNGSGFFFNYRDVERLYDGEIYYYPSLVFLGSGSGGGQTLGSPLGVSAVPSVSYVYNDDWFNVTVTATFSFQRSVTVSEAMLAAINEQAGPNYYAIVYDSFPPVSVPAGGSLTVQWVFAWKDYGAFTENWGRLWQYALTLNYGGTGQYADFTDDAGATARVPWPNRYSGATVALRLAWGTGTSPMSRSSYRLQGETGSEQAGFSVVGTGFSVGAAVGGQATEVGLYWLAADVNGIPRRILLMRWVPSYALPAGTPVNVYIARGG